MAEKSSRRQILERSLADDPDDPFLRYGLALQCLGESDTREGRDRLIALIADLPDAPETVAACQQLGQSYLDSHDFELARQALEAGIAKAQKQGHAHAAAEMNGLLAQLD
ncbi:MAG: hypothetical protein ABI353_15535 [Isosphaeraceae bacterium]